MDGHLNSRIQKSPLIRLLRFMYLSGIRVRKLSLSPPQLPSFQNHNRVAKALSGAYELVRTQTDGETTERLDQCD